METSIPLIHRYEEIEKARRALNCSRRKYEKHSVTSPPNIHVCKEVEKYLPVILLGKKTEQIENQKNVSILVLTVQIQTLQDEVRCTTVYKGRT